jgi:hypothetical protein
LALSQSRDRKRNPPLRSFYSAECVEGFFSELRVYGVLRSSLS